ncbi:hypothetical protein B0H11DRAFT_641932 [Mycena galericulata]|nr:hypothetical protein B0H11DRAFT_641932 [Mycena galericulata]
MRLRRRCPPCGGPQMLTRHTGGRGRRRPELQWKRLEVPRLAPRTWMSPQDTRHDMRVRATSSRAFSTPRVVLKHRTMRRTAVVTLLADSPWRTGINIARLRPYPTPAPRRPSLPRGTGVHSTTDGAEIGTCWRVRLDAAGKTTKRTTLVAGGAYARGGWVGGRV